jgi:hypothetical protein
MAADVQRNWVQGSAVLTTGLNSLANAGGADSSMQTLGSGHVGTADATGPFEIAGVAVMVGSSASNTGRVDIYWKPSRDGTNADDNTNAMLIDTVQMAGTATMRKHFLSGLLAYPSGIVRVVNNSGAALASSGNSVTIDEVTTDLA